MKELQIEIKDSLVRQEETVKSRHNLTILKNIQHSNLHTFEK